MKPKATEYKRHDRQKPIECLSCCVLVTKAENGEAGAEHTELKEATANQQLRDGGGGGAGDGADTAQSHSSSQSRRSNKSSGYDRLAFPRQDLQNMVLLGETFHDY